MTVPNTERGVPLRLYFKLEPDQTADAEVVSRAALAFIAGVKELAYLIDPSSPVHVGLEGHVEGSLWEDLLLLFGKVKDEYADHSLRYNLAFAAIAWILTPPAERVRDNLWQPYLDKYLPEATPEQRAAAKQTVDRVAGAASREKEQFYREIGRDTAIAGVGAVLDRTRPPVLVPRADFPTYSGQAPTIISDQDRTTVGPLRVVIVSPVFDVSNRRWRFATAQSEFGAAVKDRAFLERIVQGQTAVRMRGGVELDVQLETKERLIDGVWTIVERNVLHVDNIMEPTASRQGSMFPENGEDH